MSSDPYSARVRELFFRPVHAGCIDEAVSVQVDDQGVRLCLCATAEDDVVSGLRFRAWGCPHVIAAAETFCADYIGKPVDSLLEFSATDLMKSLPVPVEKTGRILVIEGAVRTLGQAIRDTQSPDD